MCEIFSFFLYCGICYLYICKVCVGEYILDEFIEYKVVLFNKWEFVIKCLKYFMKICEFFCKDCSIFICVICVFFGEYIGYVYIEILKFFES